MTNPGGGPKGPPASTNNTSEGDLNRSQNNANNINANNTINKSQITYLYEGKDDGPYYVFIESLDLNEKGISRMHPMSLGKLLKKLFPNTEIRSMKKNGRNRIKIQVPTRDLANEIIQSKELKEAQFKAYVPKFILFRQGIIRDVDRSLTEEELLEEISPLYTLDAKVTEVKRFNRRTTDEDGNVKYLPTGTIQVTFRAQAIPTHVSIFYVRCVVEKYVPKVLQCANCLRFGHTAKFCKGSVRCSKCGDGHDDKDCNKDISEQKCIHCEGPHSSRVNFKNPVCPEFEKQKSIKNLMVDENITFFEAKTKLSSNYSRLFARKKQDVRFEKEIRPSENTDNGIRKLPSVRKAMFSPRTPDKILRKKMRQESPKNEEFLKKCQEVAEEYRYDTSQFPNGVCLSDQNMESTSHDQTTNCTLEFENVDKLTEFISSVFRNSVHLVGTKGKMTQTQLQGVIQKQLLSNDRIDEGHDYESNMSEGDSEI